SSAFLSTNHPARSSRIRSDSKRSPARRFAPTWAFSHFFPYGMFARAKPLANWRLFHRVEILSSVAGRSRHLSRRIRMRQRERAERRGSVQLRRLSGCALFAAPHRADETSSQGHHAE